MANPGLSDSFDAVKDALSVGIFIYPTNFTDVKTYVETSTRVHCLFPRRASQQRSEETCAYSKTAYAIKAVGAF